MGVWMILISLFNAEVFVDATMTLPHNKIKLRIYIFSSIYFLMETCATHVVIF